MLKNFGKIMIGLIIMKNLFCIVGLKVEGGKWHVGTGSSGTWVSPSTFTVKNIGDEPIKVEIKATNSQNWTLGTSPGLDTFSIQYGNGTSWTPITVDFTTLISKLNPNQIFSFFLRYQSPTEVSDPYLTTTQFSTITFAAELTVMIATSYIFVNEWGGHGSGDGQFIYPHGITVDDIHNMVYVVDRDNTRIQKFDINGNFIAKWGKPGSGDGEFTDPHFITIDPNRGFVYITEQGDPITGNHRVQKFDLNGGFITKWGGLGWEDGKFCFPYGIGVDSEGNVYVGDCCHKRIQKFDMNGNFLIKWGREGEEEGQFRVIRDLDVDLNGNVYAVDEQNRRIQKFDSSGNFLLLFVVSAYTYGICTDSLGYVYVTAPFEYVIRKYTPLGSLVCEIKTNYKPRDIDVDSNGKLYVTDETNHRIVVYTPQY